MRFGHLIIGMTIIQWSSQALGGEPRISESLCVSGGNLEIKISDRNVLNTIIVSNSSGHRYSYASIYGDNLIFHNNIPLEENIRSISILFNADINGGLRIRPVFYLFDGKVVIYWKDLRGSGRFGLLDFDETRLVTICEGKS